MDQLVMTWQGKDISSSTSGDLDLHSLTFGQGILAIIILSSFFGIALLILGFELIFNKLKPTKKVDPEQTEPIDNANLTKIIQENLFEYLTMNLDHDNIKEQYDLAETYFANQPDDRPIVSETVAQALKIVKIIELVKNLAGKDDKAPWIFHRQIKTFEVEEPNSDESKDEERQNDTEIVELE